MFDDDIARWLSRLPLAERVHLRRCDETADAYQPEAQPKRPRCACCGVRLTPVDEADPLRRCSTCRSRRRMERRVVVRVVLRSTT